MANPNNYEDFKQQALDAVSHWQHPEAKKLLYQIDQARLESLKNADSDLYSKYKKLQTLLEITAIPVLSNEEVLEIVKTNLLTGFAEEMDIAERLELKLLIFPELVRDNFKEQISKAILSNEQRLGNKFVKDWLLNYNQTAGAKKHTSVERTEYMMKNKEVQALNEQDKILLRKLLTLYDEMKIEMTNFQFPISNKNQNVQ